jgi:hypothetical protein
MLMGIPSNVRAHFESSTKPHHLLLFSPLSFSPTSSQSPAPSQKEITRIHLVRIRVMKNLASRLAIETGP